MLRHKAMIQAARIAFGFVGIYDEDEGRRIADTIDAPKAVTSPKASPNKLRDALKIAPDAPAAQEGDGRDYPY